MRAPLRILGASVAVAAVAVTIPLLHSPEAQAAGFTGGDLVVYRVGDGTTALTNAAAPVFLDEVSPTGTPVQSLALPTTAADGNLPLTAAGESRSEGLISRSPDGRFVTLTGYAAPLGTTGPNGTSLTASDPASVRRVVGIVDGHGGIDTSSALSGASAPSIIRSAATSNGDDLVAAGGNGGLLATSLGSTETSVLAGDASSNLSSVSYQAGGLYTSGILADRLATVSGTSLTDLTGLPDNLLTYGYAVLDLDGNGAADTLYLANASERGGTIDKYRSSGGAWTSAGSLDVPGATGLVANATSGSVNLAVTTPTQLIDLTDPAGSASTFAATAPTTLATAPAGTEFRGVALAPTAAAGPSVFVRTPVRGSSVSAATPTIAVTSYVPGSPSSVKVAIGSSTASATQSGHLWTAQVPTSGLPSGPTTVTVLATDGSGTTTATRPIALTDGSTVPAGALTAGKHAPSDPKVKRTGAWKAYATTASPTRKGLTDAKKRDKLTASVYGSKLVLSFTKGPKAGKVAVSVDGKVTTIDLYAKRPATLSKAFAFAGALRAHPLTITVAGTKNPRSGGTAVYVAALQVS